MKTLGILLPYPPYLSDIIDEAKKEFSIDELNVIYAKDKEERLKALKESNTVISGPLSGDELGLAENLKMIQVPYAGVDEFDLNDVMAERGIILANVHGNALSVAEHAFALLLALAKGVVRNDRDLRQGYWHGWMSREPNMELEGKTLCIVGVGSIGRNVARIAKAFGMKVLGVKKTVEQVDNVDKVYADYELLDAIKDADFVVIALPTTNETRHLFNKKIFEKMKGKYLINVGRGDVINETDLFVALKDHVLKGAAIDTWWVYPEKPYEFSYPAHYPFWLLDNIILSSHTAGYSDGSIRKNWTEAVRNVMRFFAGKPVKNVISIEKGY